LLSGGEQALTAIALIFALFLTNPAPICVLDEVDAPLDDANIERFCSLLDRMTQETDTRYLIVTHNAVTMSRMHRLFGVTMIEKASAASSASTSAAPSNCWRRNDLADQANLHSGSLRHRRPLPIGRDGGHAEPNGGGETKAVSQRQSCPIGFLPEQTGLDGQLLVRQHHEHLQLRHDRSHLVTGHTVPDQA
jgi:hypothetical protein